MLLEIQKAQDTIFNLQKLGAAKDEYIRVKSRDVDKVKQELKILKGMHARELEMFRTEITKSVDVAVCEARIMLAGEALDPSFANSSWDVEGWKDRLAKLQGKDVESSGIKAIADPEDKGKDAEGKVVAGLEGLDAEAEKDVAGKVAGPGDEGILD
jgi:hypothetical protein